MVGIPAHPRADAYFRLAQPMSDVLIDIENGVIPGLGAGALYGLLGAYTQRMLEIITNWSIATGRNIKDPTLRQPIANVLQGPVTTAASTAMAATPARNGSSASRIPSALR